MSREVRECQVCRRRIAVSDICDLCQFREHLYRDMIAREEARFLNGAPSADDVRAVDLDAYRYLMMHTRRPARMQIPQRDPVFRTAYPAAFVPSDADLHAELNALERQSNWTPAVPPLGPHFGDAPV